MNDASPKTVLVIDDNEGNLALFVKALERAGYDTLEARDGMEGIRLARDHLRPDLIILDFVLPDLSGKDVIMLIKSDDALKEIPVIATTAFPFDDDDNPFDGLGFVGCIRKPIDIPEFLELIASHLRKTD